MITFADVVRVCPEVSRIGCTMMDRDNALKYGQRLAECLFHTQTTPEITAALAAWWLLTEFRQPVPKSLVDATNGLVKTIACSAIDVLEQRIEYENKLFAQEHALAQEKAAHAHTRATSEDPALVNAVRKQLAERLVVLESAQAANTLLQTQLDLARTHLAAEQTAHTQTKARFDTTLQQHAELQTQVDQLTMQLAAEKASVARLTGELEEATKPAEPKPKNKNKQTEKSDE